MDEDELDRELDNENAILNENDQEDAHFVEEIAEAIADPVVAPDAVADLGIAEPGEVVNPASRNSGVGTAFRRQIQVEEEGELSDDDDHAGSVLNSTTHRDVDESDGDDSEGGGGGNLQEAAHGLENLPGFSRHIMGQGLVGIPAVFATGNSGYWLPFTTEGPFGENNRVAPVRVETIFVPIGFIAKDASCIGEWETQSDPSARSRSVAYSALLGMMATGTAKGWICSDEHCELQNGKTDDMDDDEKRNFIKKLNGNLSSNTYYPNRLSGDQARQQEVAMQYTWVFEERYDQNETLAGFSLHKLIYDSSFSSDQHWSYILAENKEVARHGTINSVAENIRNTRMMAQNKLQRAQINPDEMHKTAWFLPNPLKSHHKSHNPQIPQPTNLKSHKSPNPINQHNVQAVQDQHGPDPHVQPVRQRLGDAV
tara:strand:- start:22 stop:1299 length:1278 start_codon:yes stop_codon:yes gene_type:complete